MVTNAAASAAGQFASGGYTTIYDGVIGPWFLPTFRTAAGIDTLGFRDEDAARHLHDAFTRSSIAPPTRAE